MPSRIISYRSKIRPYDNTEDLIPIDAFGFTPGYYMDLFYTGKELLCFNSYNDRPIEVWKLDP